MVVHSSLPRQPIEGDTGGSGNPFDPPTGTDAITVTYPDTVTEVYKYRTGGIAGTVLMTITVTYTTAAKNDVLTVVKT